MSWRDKLSPRLRDALADEQCRAELLLELIRMLDERDKPKDPPPPVKVVTWFERPNPQWTHPHMV